MKTILYIGNMRPLGQATVSMMETHSGLLKKHFQVVAASAQKNKALRLLDMVWTLLRHQHRAACVVISVYSTLNFYYAWVVALLCRAFQKPYVAYLHGGNLPARLSQSPRMSKAIFGHSLGNVAPSGYLKTAFERAGFPARLIPNFIQIEKYPFVQRTQLRPRLLWVRAFEKTYHPEMTIQVFAEITQHYPEAELCMVGPDKDGSMQICKNLAAERGLTSQIQFTGGLPKSEWIALAAHYDLFISTTRFDNTPVSVVEAMALGIPVVSTEVGGLPFLIENGLDGLLSADGDASAMAENILQLLSSPTRAAAICQRARKKAETFDWAVVEKQWLELLHPNT